MKIEVSEPEVEEEAIKGWIRDFNFEHLGEHTRAYEAGEKREFTLVARG